MGSCSRRRWLAVASLFVIHTGCVELTPYYARESDLVRAHRVERWAEPVAVPAMRAGDGARVFLDAKMIVNDTSRMQPRPSLTRIEATHDRRILYSGLGQLVGATAMTVASGFLFASSMCDFCRDGADRAAAVSYAGAGMGVGGVLAGIITAFVGVYRPRPEIADGRADVFYLGPPLPSP